jgi:SAM-dependent methyltransferase
MPPVQHLDGLRLHHPCHCGGTHFAVYPPLRFRSCEIGRCTQCGQLRTIPEPRVEEVACIYSQQSSKYAWQPDADPARVEMWRDFAGGILELVEQHLGSRGLLLDVGADQGDLLRVAASRGWQAEALEVNQGNAHRLTEEGFRAYDRPIEEADVPADRYDAVILNQVLEHLHQPVTALRAIRAALKRTGVLFVGVPCFTSPIPLALKRSRWYALLPDEHVWQFGPKTLRQILSAGGFRVVSSQRGCSAFWGRPGPSVRSVVRWLAYRAVQVGRQGDFLNVVARPL